MSFFWWVNCDFYALFTQMVGAHDTHISSMICILRYTYRGIRIREALFLEWLVDWSGASISRATLIYPSPRYFNCQKNWCLSQKAHQQNTFSSYRFYQSHGTVLYQSHLLDYYPVMCSIPIILKSQRFGLRFMRL